MPDFKDLEALKQAIYDKEQAPADAKHEATQALYAVADSIRGSMSRDDLIRAVSLRMKDFRRKKRDEERAKLPPRA